MKKAFLLILIVLVAALSGCVRIEPGPAAPPGPPAQGQQSSQVQPEKPQQSPLSLHQGTVVRVVDGDTIKVRLGDKQETVRLIGVDTPETVQPNHPVEPYGKEASAFTKSQLNGQTVFIEKDVQERDRYGRLLAYVWTAPPGEVSDKEIREKLFNAQLLLGGYAQILTVPPDVKYVDFFTAYQKEARNGKKGLWGLSKPAH